MVMLFYKVPHWVARLECLTFVPAAEIYHVLKIVTVNMEIIAYNAFSPENLIETLETSTSTCSEQLRICLHIWQHWFCKPSA